jgi:hypothetical protein
LTDKKVYKADEVGRVFIAASQKVAPGVTVIELSAGFSRVLYLGICFRHVEQISGFFRFFIFLVPRN